MARKNSSLLSRGLDKLKGAFAAAPAEPPPAKKPAARDKRMSSANSAKRTTASVAAAQPEGVTEATQTQAADKKQDKKKIPNQPWYRHRQRW
jgi:hypothetical protein